ncbi:DUF6019 family protein [Methanimicrococcus stummii]|nr:DUF6019 family protein [Methanimicrococcus sp. Es2]
MIVLYYIVKNAVKKGILEAENEKIKTPPSKEDENDDD